MGSRLGANAEMFSLRADVVQAAAKMATSPLPSMVQVTEYQDD